jgi:hypothetical protein
VRYWLVALLGLVICGASIVAIDWGMYHLMRTGTCASGGPYVSARPCPPGTELHILSLIGGVFAGLAGMGVFAARGRSGVRRESPDGLGLAMWTLLFCTLALSGLYATFGPAASDDVSEGTAIFLAALFIPMGLAPVPFGLAGRRKAARALDLVQRGKRCKGVVVSVDDTGWTVNDNPRIKMTIRAEPDNDPPFTIEKTSVVSRVDIPRAGDTCVVFYDPSDPQNKNGVTFDPVPGFSTGRAQPAPAPMPAVTIGSPAATTAAVAAEEDPLEKIEKLGELRDKGLITPEEFEQQKQRLLREV